MQKQHEMDVDDAEMQQAQIESKQENLLQQHKDEMDELAKNKL